MTGVQTCALPISELNKLDGATVTTAELNILDGVTATTAELNILDGVTATAAELNYSDGVTSNIQTQLDAPVAGMHTVAFIANGAIANDKAVILQTNGKASQVAIADRTRTQPDPMHVSSNPINATGDDRSHHAAAWETNGNRFIWSNEKGDRKSVV